MLSVGPLGNRLTSQLNISMADGGDDIFVYLGGDQEVPDGVTHAIIDPSVKFVRMRAFYNRRQLVSVIFHDGLEIIEFEAFCGCSSLPRIKLPGVKKIGDNAFANCSALSDVEFGDRLYTIEPRAFYGCRPLRSIKMASVRNINAWAFGCCDDLNDVEFGINLVSIGVGSFVNCRHLQCITIPLKGNLFSISTLERYDQFDGCGNLATVDIVGAEGIHKTISSLLIVSWKDEMNEEIGRINRELPNTPADEKTDLIRLWISSVINRLEHYKAEHSRLLKEHMTQLELAIWTAKLDEKEEDSNQKVEVKRAKIDLGNARKEKRITSGADIIIKNVLPFLQLKE